MRLGRRCRAALVVKPFLRRIEPVPPWQCSGEVDLAPFRVAWWFLEFGDPGKECLDKSFHPLIAIDIGLRPIISDENRTNSNRLNGLAGRNHAGVVVMGERGGKIVGNKGL